MIFVDSNIPMYLAGKPHPNKLTAQVLLERLAANSERLVTDAEVLQEILHRYWSIGRRDAVAPVLQILLDIADEVYRIEKSDVLRAAEIVQNKGNFSARDALHIAIMERYEVRSILSFDADFDKWPSLRRIHAL